MFVRKGTLLALCPSGVNPTSMQYTIRSIKTAAETRTTLVAAIERAKAILAEYQPAYGVQVEDASGETVWDSEENS